MKRILLVFCGITIFSLSSCTSASISPLPSPKASTVVSVSLSPVPLLPIDSCALITQPELSIVGRNSPSTPVPQVHPEDPQKSSCTWELSSFSFLGVTAKRYSDLKSAQAVYASLFGKATPISGVGDQAFYQKSAQIDIFDFTKGTVLVEINIQYALIKDTSNPSYSATALSSLAQKIIAKLQ